MDYNIWLYIHKILKVGLDEWKVISLAWDRFA